MLLLPAAAAPALLLPLPLLHLCPAAAPAAAAPPLLPPLLLPPLTPVKSLFPEGAEGDGVPEELEKQEVFLREREREWFEKRVLFGRRLKAFALGAGCSESNSYPYGVRMDGSPILIGGQ